MLYLTKACRLTFFFFIYFCLFYRNTECVEKILRAYIPQKSVEWFRNFTNNYSEIDVWLSTRLNSENNATMKNFKYYSEFRVKNFDVIDLNNIELEKNHIKLEVLIDDFQKYLNEKNGRVKKSTIRNSKIVGRYASYNEIVAWMFELSRNHPNLIQIFRIGKTFENRPILILRMTHLTRRKELKPLFLFESGIHAREWLSIATNVFLIDKLVKQYLNSDETVTKILKKFEFHFIVVMNPDGYEFSRASKFNRYWRKNMRYTKVHSSEYACYGIDLNRNFDFKWMVSGSSANPCSEVYAGSFATSEPEIKSFQKYILSKPLRWISYISLHSYGGVWLSPFSYSKSHIQENFEETCQKAMVAIKKIEKTYGFRYRFGSASYELYEASGCGEDWAQEIAKINHTYVIELKPEKSELTPESGFEYPENKINEAALEIYDGLIEYIKTFFSKNIDKSIVEECHAKLKDMQSEMENYESSGNWRLGPEFKEKKSNSKI